MYKDIYDNIFLNILLLDNLVVDTPVSSIEANTVWGALRGK